MNGYFKQLQLNDNRGRRLGKERRHFFYTVHIPERRNCIDRRDGCDRREVSRAHSLYLES